MAGHQTVTTATRLVSGEGCHGRTNRLKVEHSTKQTAQDLRYTVSRPILWRTRKLSRDVTKPTKWVCAQQRLRSAWATAQSDQSLRCPGIRPIWSESSLSAWRNLESLAAHWAHSEDSYQTGRMSRLIWVFTGRTFNLLVLSWGDSNVMTVPILKHFKNATLDLMPISSRKPNNSSYWYWNGCPINWLVFDTKIKTFWLKVTVTLRKLKSNPKFKSHRFHKITLWAKKSFVTSMHFQQPK